MPVVSVAQGLLMRGLFQDPISLAQRCAPGCFDSMCSFGLCSDTVAPIVPPEVRLRMCLIVSLVLSKLLPIPLSSARGSQATQGC